MGLTLPYTPRFVFGGTTLDLSLPITPWNKSLNAVGGSIEADSGARASFIVRREELVTFSLRFYEDEWPAVQAFIDYAQTGATIVWFLDKESGENSFVCTLDSPVVGQKYQTEADDQYPRVLMLTITLCRPQGVPWTLPPWRQIDNDVGLIVHVFKDIFSASFDVIFGSGEIEGMLVAAGGSSGSVDGTGVVAGAGGGGEVHFFNRHVTPGRYPIEVGSDTPVNLADHTFPGGVLGVLTGNTGGDTTFNTPQFFAKGGGGGGGGDATILRRGRNGGSGGGGASSNDAINTPTGPSNAGGKSLTDPFPGGDTTTDPNRLGWDGGNGGNTDAVSGGGGGGALGPGDHGNSDLNLGGPGFTTDFATPGGDQHEYGRGGYGTKSGAIRLDPTKYGEGGAAGGGNTGEQGRIGFRGIAIIRYPMNRGIIATGGIITVYPDGVYGSGWPHD